MKRLSEVFSLSQILRRLALSVPFWVCGFISTNIYAADVFISTPPFNPDSGQQFDIEISVDVGVNVLGSYYLNFIYDPSVITIVSVAGGTATGFTVPPATDVTTFSSGVTPIAFAQEGLLAPVGTAHVATVTLQASGLTGAVSALDIQVIELNNATGTALVVENVVSTSIQLKFNAADDTDGDGLSDLMEANVGTDINIQDTDGDGLLDGFEVLNGLDAFDNGDADISQGATGDPDGDGLTNIQEQSAGSNPLVVDTDSDGLNDNVEVSLGTNPSLNDSDGDGLFDQFEINGTIDPLDNGSGDIVNGASGDPDNDGLTNIEEQLNLTNPTSDDTDGDSLLDGYEVSFGLDPTDDGSIDFNQGALGDVDDDGLNNLDEYSAGTNPARGDTDNDLLSDLFEVSYGLDPLDDGSVDFNQGPGGDPDNDSHDNLLEAQVNSNPLNSHSQPLVSGLDLVAGLQPVFYPLNIPLDFSAYDLLNYLNSNGEFVSSIRLIRGGSAEVATYSSGLLQGSDFLLEPGIGVIAKVESDTSFPFYSAITCPSINLQAGINVVGLKCIPVGYDAFQLLQSIGTASVVRSVQAFNTADGRYKTAIYNDTLPAGENFPIRTGEAYLIYMLSDRVGFDPLQ
jgi:hypothetical protein